MNDPVPPHPHPAKVPPAARSVFILGLLSLGIWPFSVPGVIFASRVLAQMRKAHPAARDRRLVLAGMVLAWLSLLSWPAAVLYPDFKGGSETARARAQMNSIHVALTAYKHANGTFPAALTHLDQPPASARSSRRFMDPAGFIDPWGKPFHYRFPNAAQTRGYDLRSSGPDLIPGSADDVTFD